LPGRWVLCTRDSGDATPPTLPVIDYKRAAMSATS